MWFYHFARGIVLFAMRFAYKIKVVGKENIPLDRGIILASNHRTNADPVFIGIGCKRTVRFMAKEELFKNKFFGFLIKHLGAFPVIRGGGDSSALSTAEQIVADGGVLGIFPEGTRSKDGKLGRAKSGTVVIAEKTGGDIIPVGIKFGEKIIWRRRITITYGKPIMTKSLNLGEHSKAELKFACELLMSEIAKLIEG